MVCLAMDQVGNMGLGFSVSSSSLHPEVHYTGRLATDALGTMGQGEGTIIAGAGSQDTSLSRWGDYSSMWVDPVDDCTFWYSTEYLASTGTFNWHTRIGSFRFPSCGSDFSISAAPATASAPQGSSTGYTVSTAVTKGSAQTVTLSASGLPSGATASFNPSSVAAGASSTMTVNVGATTAPATYTLTIQGTETGGIAHSAQVSL